MNVKALTKPQDLSEISSVRNDDTNKRVGAENEAIPTSASESTARSHLIVAPVVVLIRLASMYLAGPASAKEY